MTFRFTHWPTPNWGHITQRFGANKAYYGQFGPDNKKLKGHDGIDFATNHGDHVYAVAPGRVSDINHTGLKPSGRPHSYGIFVRVDHEDGYQTTYAHLSAVMVSKGDQVLGGQLLGLAGNTGNIRSGDSHLHLTLKRFPIGDRGWPYNIADPTLYIMELLKKGGESYPKVAAVIGRLEDVKAYMNKPGYVCYVEEQRYNLDDNLAWLEAILDNGYPILIVSDPREAKGTYLIELAKILGKTVKERDLDRILKRRRTNRLRLPKGREKPK